MCSHKSLSQGSNQRKINNLLISLFPFFFLHCCDQCCHHYPPPLQSPIFILLSVKEGKRGACYSSPLLLLRKSVKWGQWFRGFFYTALLMSYKWDFASLMSREAISGAVFIARKLLKVSFRSRVITRKSCTSVAHIVLITCVHRICTHQ